MTPTMMKIAFYAGTDKGAMKSFKLIPISNACPFNEAIFDPFAKILGVISKEMYPATRLVPKLDNNGLQIPLPSQGNGAVKLERIVLDTHYDFQLHEQADIEKFMKNMTGEDHDISDYFKITQGEDMGQADGPPALLAKDGSPLQVVKD